MKSLLTASGNVKDFGPGGKDIDWGAGISIAYNAVKAAGGYSGSFSDGLQHAYWAGSLSGSGDSDVYSVTVTDSSRPLGLTMNMASNPSCGIWSCSPDFDLYLYDPAGRLVARSEGTAREERILYQPTATAPTLWRSTATPAREATTSTPATGDAGGGYGWRMPVSVGWRMPVPDAGHRGRGWQLKGPAAGPARFVY